MVEIDAARIAGLMADEARRRVVAALVLADGPLTTAALTESAGLDVRAATDALDRLAPLVCGDHRTNWSLDVEIFAAAARSQARARPGSAFPDEPSEIARVLDTAFADGKLVHFPTKRNKRLVVLDHLAQRFEIGNRYPEAEVNDMLRVVHDDVAMLRRWLVDEQFLDRGNGMYWRCGGTV